MSVAVVTDSTADMPAALVEETGIHIVPALVRFGEKEFKDGIDLDADTFYRRLENDKNLFPTTSQPSVGEFMNVYQSLLDDHEAVVSVQISSMLSGTYASALQGAQQADPNGGRIINIDSKTASMSTAWLALEVKERLDAGASAADAAQAAQDMVERTGFMGTPETLEYLRRGGRMGAAQALLGSILRIRPVIAVDNGVVVPLAKPRSHRKAVAKMRQIVEEAAPLSNLCILYSSDVMEAQELLNELKGLVSPGGRTLTSQLGPAIGAHLGPNSIAMCYSW